MKKCNAIVERHFHQIILKTIGQNIIRTTPATNITDGKLKEGLLRQEELFQSFLLNIRRDENSVKC